MGVAGVRLVFEFLGVWVFESALVVRDSWFGWGLQELG